MHYENVCLKPGNSAGFKTCYMGSGGQFPHPTFFPSPKTSETGDKYCDITVIINEPMSFILETNKKIKQSYVLLPPPILKQLTRYKI